MKGFAELYTMTNNLHFKNYLETDGSVSKHTQKLRFLRIKMFKLMKGSAPLLIGEMFPLNENSRSCEIVLILQSETVTTVCNRQDTPTHVFCCEICEIIKNTYFEEHLRTTAPH